MRPTNRPPATGCTHSVALGNVLNHLRIASRTIGCLERLYEEEVDAFIERYRTHCTAALGRALLDLSAVPSSGTQPGSPAALLR